MFDEYRGNSYLFGANAPFIEALYDRYLEDPAAVEPRWRSYFDELQRAGNGARDVSHAAVQAQLAELAHFPVVLAAEVQGVDVAARRVALVDGTTLDYDFVIVATGARHAYFGRDDWERWAPGLKTLDDALVVRRRILLAFERAEREPDPARQQALLTFVLVGGGPTGVELAGTLAEIARARPQSEDELGGITGIGARKLERYGAAVLALLRT